MSLSSIAIHEALEQRSQVAFIDVRSPGEYNKAHIEGAINIPLFDDEERAIVGTAYKQESPQKAMLIGLDIVGKKMASLAEKVLSRAAGKKLIVYCWRGGKRSGSVGWLFSQLGFEVQVVQGGYKSYRKLVLDFLAKPDFKFVVLGGKTGIGKTTILRTLQKLNEQVLDLEDLAHHKGSAFGSLGEKPQPTTEAFENLIFEALIKFDTRKRIFVENESKLIGTCVLPHRFFDTLKKDYYIQYDIPIELRLDNLIADYGHFSIEELAGRFERIKSKLGGDVYKQCLAYLAENNLKEAAALALNFYDKTYQYGLEKNMAKHKHFFEFTEFDTQQIGNAIIELCNKYNI